jgi:5'-nucleotidase
MEIGGQKIGVVGIIEKDWTVTFKNLEAQYEYQNYKRTTAMYVNQLRNDQKCDIIIALCHMRLHHDVKLAQQVLGIDIVLGGHDHDYMV